MLENTQLKEIFRTISDCEFVDLICIDKRLQGGYQINKLGYVKNLQTGVIRRPNINNNDLYPRLSFRVGDVKKDYKVHLLLANTFLDKRDDNNVVDHIDGNTKNFSLSNLQWITQSDNLKKRSFKKKPQRLFKISKGIVSEVDTKGNCKEYSIDCDLYDSEFIVKLSSDLVDYLHYLKLDVLDLFKITFRPIRLFGDKDYNISDYGIIRVKNAFTIGGSDGKGYRVLSYKRKPYRVHRLVVDTFNGILKDSEIVDHLNTITFDNRLCNLKVGSQFDNMNNVITKSKLSKAVLRFDLFGKYVEEFDSLSSATISIKSRRNLVDNRDNSIRTCCSGKNLSAFNSLWVYKEGGDSLLKEKLSKIYYEVTSDSIVAIPPRKLCTKKKSIQTSNQSVTVSFPIYIKGLDNLLKYLHENNRNIS